MNSGSIDAEYLTEITQSFQDPDSFDTVLMHTDLQILGGSLETISPRLGGYVDLVLQLGGLATLEAAIVRSLGKLGGPFTIADIDKELLAVNRDDDGELRILGETDFSTSIHIPFAKVGPFDLLYPPGWRR